MSSEDVLKMVAEEVAVCTSCELHHSRKHAVPGEGPANSDLMFIGEGPGFHENEQGRPFVGAAGKFLEELLGSIELNSRAGLHWKRRQMPPTRKSRSTAGRSQRVFRVP